MAKMDKKIQVKKVKKNDTNVILSFIKRIKFVSGSDSAINVVVLILMLFGTFMIISTDVGQTVSNSHVVLNTTVKQFIFVFFSYVLMWVANRMFSFKWFAPLQGLAIIGIWGLLGSTLLFPAIGGSKAWIQLGGLSLQPSEFAKPMIILIVASAIYLANRNPNRLRSIGKLYWTPFITFLGMGGIIVAQKDLGTLAILSAIFLMCIIVPNYKILDKMKRWMLGVFFVGSVLVLVFFAFTDIGTDLIAKTPWAHIAVRIRNFKNPYLDIYGDGYQPCNALYGIANANIWGRGIGGSARKYGYLTQANSDYIFAVLIEETGIFGLAGLAILYTILFRRLVHYAFQTEKIEYRIVLLGNVTYLFMHFFLNVGGVVSVIPSTGVPLLFISSGGSALMAFSLMIGISQKCISLIKREG